MTSPTEILNPPLVARYMVALQVAPTRPEPVLTDVPRAVLTATIAQMALQSDRLYWDDLPCHLWPDWVRPYVYCSRAYWNHHKELEEAA